MTALIQARFGYQPEVDFFDQKPFHMNESGSKGQKTLEWTGAEEVQLLECHGATRSRWTACTYTTSDKNRASRTPPAQLLFKGGEGVRQQLEDILSRLRAGGLYGDLDWLSVGTSDSGSYKMQDILKYLDEV